MKYLILILLFFAGCNEIPNVSHQADKLENTFMFIQNYGYCDTMCVGESVVLTAQSLPYSLVCYPFTVTTEDTLYKGLYSYSFQFHYNTQNEVSVNFGNGITRYYYGNGMDEVKYFCNQNYGVIICYE